MEVHLQKALYHGQPSFVAIIVDTTERKRAEQRALQAERLAAIGEMLAGIAHESRNALQRIQASVDVARMEIGDNDQAHRDLDRIEAARENLSILFDELRSYAAPIQIQRSDRDLAEVWRRAWSSLATERAERVTDLVEVTNGNGLRCAIDGFRVEQVFRNLMENALAACPGPVRIEIGCHEDILDGQKALRIVVGDNGPGLSDGQRRLIFEPFFTTKTKGTGLEMTIAKRILEAHNGVIRAGNGELGGAEFIITLPRE